MAAVSEFAMLLAQLMVPNNQIRTAAEERYFTAVAADPIAVRAPAFLFARPPRTKCGLRREVGW